MKAVFWLLCILRPQRSQSTWSIPRKALSVPQLLHSGIRGYSEVPQKPLLPTLPLQTAHQIAPSLCRSHPNKQVSQSPHCRVVTTPSAGTASHRFWDGTAAAAPRGAVPHEEHIQNSPLFLLICSSLQGIFVFIQYHLISWHT